MDHIDQEPQGLGQGRMRTGNVGEQRRRPKVMKLMGEDLYRPSGVGDLQYVENNSTAFGVTRASAVQDKVNRGFNRRFRRKSPPGLLKGIYYDFWGGKALDPFL